jgi:hypothetical protein
MCTTPGIFYSELNLCAYSYDGDQCSSHPDTVYAVSVHSLNAFLFLTLFQTCPTDLVECGVCQNFDPTCTLGNASALLNCEITSLPCLSEEACALAGLY